MAVCDVCGNYYDGTFEVVMSDGQRFVFDSVECAARKIAPKCANCGVSILGHGIEQDNTVFCCAHCARHSGVLGAADHVAGGS
ncbi:hypothetical protein [Xylanimonas sp. McL0601]|uniref:hypothetical protein n=1 Tax=Xylanimonas sp. McL0601 TaxID=3414739 RepID=UPI003CF5B262